MGEINRLLLTVKNELQNRKFKVVSFDIFDTILFRMVRKPSDVFEIIAKKALEKELLPYYITPVIYKNIRIEAEKNARKIKKEQEGNNEVSLEEIVECLPSYCCKNKKELLALEIEAEKECCYVNPDILDVLNYLKNEEECRVILTSDMYLSAEQLKEILKANLFPIEWIDEIYVSSEAKKNKKSGELYDFVLSQEHIKPEALLHIGDNYMSDVVNAQYQGISTIYYDVINSDKYMELQMEQLKYGGLLPEVYVLRRYVADKAEGFDKEKAQWFKIGAMVMGPIMTGFAEWVLDTAEKEKIKNIYPLMREGRILTRLLNQAAKYRTEDYRIEPMYISRKAAFFPSLGEWDESSFQKIFDTNRMGTVGAVLDLFEISNTDLEEFRETRLRDIHKFNIGDKTGREYLKDYLYQEEIINKINDKIQVQKSNMLQYLNSLGVEDRFFTVDLGMKGTMQEALTEILDDTGEEKNMVHLFMFGARDTLEKLLNNIDIRGYITNAGEREEIAFDVVQRPYIWEQVMMCDEGTTTGYTEDGKPITKRIDGITEKHYKKISWCQEGMLAFQKEYLELKRKKRKYLDMNTSFLDAANIAFRVMHLPTFEESKLLGSLQYDMNFGMDSVHELCPKEKIEQIKKMGISNYINSCVPGEVLWMEGLVTQVDASYYVDKILENTASGYEQSVVRIVKKVLEKNQKQVVVAGAGEAGRTMQKYLELYGITIEAFTDNNVKLQGNSINGIPVKKLQDEFQTNCYVIASFAFAEEINKQILELKGNDVVVCHY